MSLNFGHWAGRACLLIFVAGLAIGAAQPVTAQQPFDIGVEVVSPATAISGSKIIIETKVTNRYTKAHPKDAEITIIGVFEKQSVLSAKWSSPGVVNACQVATDPTGTSFTTKFKVESFFNCVGKLTDELKVGSQIVITSELKVTAVPPTDGIKFFIEYCAFYNADGPWDDVKDSGVSKNSDCKKIQVLPAVQPWDLKLKVEPLPLGTKQWDLGVTQDALVTVETVTNTPSIPPGVTVRALVGIPNGDAVFNLALTTQSPTAINSVSGPNGWVCGWGMLFGGALAVCQLEVGAGGFTSGSFKVPVIPTLNSYDSAKGWRTLSGNGGAVLAPPYTPSHDVNQTNNNVVFGPIKVQGVDIGLSKTAIAKPWSFGSPQTFAISVGNGGIPLDKSWLNPSKPITIEDKLASPFKYVGFSGTDWKCNPPPAQTVKCSYMPSGSGSLFPIPTLKIDVEVVGAGSNILNVATLLSGPNDGPKVTIPSIPGKELSDAFFSDNSASTTVDVASPFDIKMVVTPGESDWKPQSKPKHKINVENVSVFKGSSLDIPAGIDVNIDYQAGLHPIAVEPATHPAWTCAAYTPPVGLFVMTGLKCSRSGPMPKGAKEDIFVSFQAPKAGDVITIVPPDKAAVWDGKTSTGALLNCARGRLSVGDKNPSDNDACFAVTVTP